NHRGLFRDNHRRARSMTLLATDGADHYTDITQKYSLSSTAVVTAGAGRKGSSGIVTTYNSTFFVLDRGSFGQVFSSLTFIRGIVFKFRALHSMTFTFL